MVTTGTGNGLRARGYTPYGYAPPSDSRQSVLGYNGEYADQVTGSYHLGNGYRAYSPTLMRFTAPDSLSPFGGGGLNTYAYCAGDPINASDPSGHMKWQEWLEFGISVGTALVGFGFNGYEALTAYSAIQKFTGIAEEEGFDLTRTFAKRLVTMNRNRLIGHGVLAGKDLAAVGIEAIIYSAPPSKLRTILKWVVPMLAMGSDTIGILHNWRFKTQLLDVEGSLLGARNQEQVAYAGYHGLELPHYEDVVQPAPSYSRSPPSYTMSELVRRYETPPSYEQVPLRSTNEDIPEPRPSTSAHTHGNVSGGRPLSRTAAKSILPPVPRRGSSVEGTYGGLPRTASVTSRSIARSGSF